MFNLFFTPPIETFVIKGPWGEVRITNSVEDGTPIDFEISGSGIEYFDLASTFVKTKVRVMTPGGLQGFAKDTEVTPSR